MSSVARKVLWWGHFDPDYSRNRILRQCLSENNFISEDFRPRFSRLGNHEARLRGIPNPDLLWVPCFRQRDLAAAVRWGQKRKIPVIFDPLISAYDKQVFERNKFSPGSSRAKRLLTWESGLFQEADLVLADTREHARFFVETLGVESSRVAVVPVGAEENLFKPYPAGQVRPESPLSVLFFGSFLNLQGPEVIVRAAKLYRGAPVRWKLLGEGPQLESCRQLAGDLDTLQFLPWLAYEELPALINSADILLGVFGATDKAARVIPNKVYQALACGKPLITRGAPAYPDHFSGNDNLGIRWVPAGDPAALARTVAELAEDPENLVEIGLQARQTYEDHFSMRTISQALRQALAPIAPDQKDNG